MPLDVTFTDDPARVLCEAGKLLTAEPVRNNTMLNLLHGRVTRPEPGRYWLAKRDGAVVGIVFQSPLDYPLLLTSIEPDAVAPLVDAIVSARVSAPGLSGPVTTAAAFTGRWTEATGCGAVPTQGMRIYEATAVAAPAGVNGRLRQAVIDDRDLLLTWMRDFLANNIFSTAEQMVERHLPEGRFWIWDDGGPVSVARVSPPMAGVLQVSAVYTPPENRNRGFASACVADLTARILTGGHRAMLYTNLANPTSNSIYRRIGYRAVEEWIRYRFEATSE
jgi:predicted GNAT family acetyltransferase